MKKDVRKVSSEQFYIDVSDSLAALRSAKGFVYFLIGAAVLLNCVFHVFFGLFPVKSVSYKGNDEVVVVARISVGSYEKDETVLCFRDEEYFCARVSQPAPVAENGVYISTPQGQRIVDYENICGRAEFVVLPFTCFGDSVQGLCE